MFIVVFSTCCYVCKSLLSLSREKRESTPSFLSSFFLEVTHTHTYTPLLGLELTTSPSILLLPQVTLSHFYYVPPVSIRDFFGFFSSLASIEVLSVQHVPLSWKSLHSPLCHKNVFPPDSCFGLWIWCSLLCVCPTNFIVFSLSLDAFFSEFFFFNNFHCLKKKKIMCLEYNRV